MKIIRLGTYPYCGGGLLIEPEISLEHPRPAVLTLRDLRLRPRPVGLTKWQKNEPEKGVLDKAQIANDRRVIWAVTLFSSLSFLSSYLFSFPFNLVSFHCFSWVTSPLLLPLLPSPTLLLPLLLP